MFGVATKRNPADVEVDPDDHQFSVNAAWRKRVLEALGPERGAQAKLAKAIDCSPVTLNNLLLRGKRSELVPKINAYFGWDLPKLAPSGSSDQHEIEVFLKKMGKTGREIFRHLKEVAGDDPTNLAPAAALLAQMAEMAKRQSND